MNKNIQIGVYRFNDPIKAQRSERVKAILMEAEKQNVELVFFNDTSFTSKDLSVLQAKVFKDNNWIDKMINLPSVIINVIPPLSKNRTHIEKELRRKSIFTSYLIDNKKVIYDKILNAGNYSEYVIPSQVPNSYNDILDYLDKFSSIVMKPVNGRKGKEIYHIFRDKFKYIIKDHNKEYIKNLNQFKGFLQKNLSKKQWLLQPYIRCISKDGRPFDFRVHVQRDANGMWVLTKIYPRIGGKDTILSNISKGGKTLDIHEFLHNQYGNEGIEIKRKLVKLAIELANHINSFYKFQIDELGIDLSIDAYGDIWLYEVNTGPESKYHEEERAINTIAYAKYIYNSKYKKNNKSISKNETIAMLSDTRYGDNLKIMCDFSAKSYGKNFFYFTRKGVDYKNKKINGYYYDGINLKTGVFDYPDVIIDRLRYRGLKGGEKIYEEFKDIPFNICTNGGSFPKLSMQKILEKNSLIKPYIIPTLKIKNSKQIHVIDFIDANRSVFLKLNGGSFGKRALQINKKADVYEIKSENKLYSLNQGELIDYFNSGKLKGYICQKNIKSINKYSRSSDLRVHILKNKNNNWEIGHIYARSGAPSSLVSNFSKGGYMETYEKYLNDNFPEKKEDLIYEIKSLAFMISKYLDDYFNSYLPHIALDLGIDEQGNIWIFEVNINKPMPVLCEHNVAKLLVEYCLFILKEINNKK